MAKSTVLAIAAFGAKVHAFIRLCQADAVAKGKTYKGAHILYSKVDGVSFADIARASGFLDAGKRGDDGFVSGTQKATDALKAAGLVDIGFARGGPVLYLPGQAPVGRAGPSADNVAALMARL